MKTSTKAWDKIFQQKGVFLTEPHSDINTVVRTLQETSAKTILDLGCGSGRHVVFLAKQGFSVYGLDNSKSGLGITKRWLEKEHLEAELVQQEMTCLLYISPSPRDS